MHYMTPIPNEVFDVYLRELKPGELKVLLLVLRQTLGYVKHKGSKRRKDRDWISISQFKGKTGCDAKTISKAIQALIELELIAVTDISRRSLPNPNTRRGKKRLFFAQTIRPGDSEWI
ncbi:MAG: hypothetical protein AAF135_07985 [Bacteroidota bacterium]